MKDDHYIQIAGWMVNHLGLKGSDLVIYALIHGYSRDFGHKFKGSISYIEKATGFSNSTVKRSLKNLTRDKFIIKHPKEINGVTLCDYSHNSDLVLLRTRGGQNDTTPGQNDTGGRVKMTYHNTIDNTKDNNKSASASLFPSSALNEKKDLQSEDNARASFGPADVITSFSIIKRKFFVNAIKLKLNASRSKTINARIDEGYTLADFSLTIEHMCKKWYDNPKMKSCITPETIFRASNFTKYYEEAKTREIEVKKKPTLKSAYNE